MEVLSRDLGAPPVDGGIKPPPPIEPPLIDVDEGPMRGDLRRQIRELERVLQRLKAAAFPHEATEASPKRGPGLLGAEDLERVRDELIALLSSLERRLAAQQVAGLVTELPPPSLLSRLAARLRALRSRKP